MIARFETFTRLISCINRNIHRIKSVFMEELGLKSSHVSCIYYLEREGRLSVKELADLCSDDKANLSRAATYLETEGYVTRTAGKRAHTVYLSLTERGHEVGRRIFAAVTSLLSETGALLTEEERQVMYFALNKINDKLDSYSTDADNGTADAC